MFVCVFRDDKSKPIGVKYRNKPINSQRLRQKQLFKHKITSNLLLFLIKTKFIYTYLCMYYIRMYICIWHVQKHTVHTLLGEHKKML